MINVYKINKYKEFLTLNELYEQFIQISDEKNVSQIGISKNNERILCGKFGTGKKTALLFAYGHPNEPVGSLTCLSWVQILKKNPQLLKRYTWYVVPCIDPDGAKLNEGWFKGKFSIKKYAYHFYRQVTEQTEHCFPVTYKKYSFNKPTQPTKILMQLIKKIKPSLLYPIHNSGFSGAYVLLTKNLGVPFFETVERMCKRLQIPIQRESPETPSTNIWRPGFIKLPRLQDEYDELVKHDQDPLKNLIGGWSSIDYAMSQNKNLVGLVCEVPYIYDPVFLNDKPSQTTRKAAKQNQIDENFLIRGIITQALRLEGLNKKSVFFKVTKDNHELLNIMINSLSAILPKLSEENCTRAEEFFSKIVNVFYRTLMLGQLRRLLLDSEPSIEKRRAMVEIENMIEARIKYIKKNSRYQIMPISSLVEFQVSCLVAALEVV